MRASPPQTLHGGNPGEGGTGACWAWVVPKERKETTTNATRAVVHDVIIIAVVVAIVLIDQSIDRSIVLLYFSLLVRSFRNVYALSSLSGWRVFPPPQRVAKRKRRFANRTDR